MISEKPTLGALQAVTEAAASVYARWHKFPLAQKGEILSLLQAFFAIEFQREQRAHADQLLKAQHVSPFGQLGVVPDQMKGYRPTLAPAVADE